MSTPFHAFIVVDPVQDYEESAVILGAYGSEEDARTAVPLLETARGNWRNGYFPDRYFEIQQWAGDEQVRVITIPATVAEGIEQ